MKLNLALTVTVAYLMTGWKKGKSAFLCVCVHLTVLDIHKKMWSFLFSVNPTSEKHISFISLVKSYVAWRGRQLYFLVSVGRERDVCILSCSKVPLKLIIKASLSLWVKQITYREM